MSGELQWYLLALSCVSAAAMHARGRVPEEVPPEVDAVIDSCLDADAAGRPSALDLVGFFSTWGAEGVTPRARSSALLDVAARHSSCSSSNPGSAAASSSGDVSRGAAHATPCTFQNAGESLAHRCPAGADFGTVEQGPGDGASIRPAAPIKSCAAGREGAMLELAPAAPRLADRERPAVVRGFGGSMDKTGGHGIPVHVPAEAADVDAATLDTARVWDGLEPATLKKCRTGNGHRSHSRVGELARAPAVQQRHTPLRRIPSPFAGKGA